MKHRVLIVEPSGLLWGSERALLDLLAHIDRDRYEIIVALPPNAPLASHLDALGIERVDVSLQLLHRRGRVARLRVTAELFALIGRLTPDVIHVNQAGVTRLVLLAAAGRVPVLSHVRLLEDARVISNARAMKLRAAAYIAISQAVYDEMAPQRWGGSSRVHLVHDPFDADRFRQTLAPDARRRVRAELGLAPETPLATLVGRLCREKGQHVLIEAIEFLSDSRVTIALVGGQAPGDNYQTELESLVRRSGIANRIIVTGERNDIANIMAASDVLVLASNAEPFGRVLLEALSVGTPIVASTAGGAYEIVGDDERGLGFPPGNARLLAQRIEAVFRDPDGAKARTQRGAAYVAEVCSPAAHARAIERCYTQLVTARRAQPLP